MVGAKGFEPSTSWSRIRFHASLKSMKFCGLQWIENKYFVSGRVARTGFDFLVLAHASMVRIPLL
jgi:hypothetical protein